MSEFVGQGTNRTLTLHTVLFSDRKQVGDRGQSETFGVVLLLGVAVIGAVAVAATGFAAVDRDQQRVGTAQAERALSQFDSQASDVALGRSDSARVDLGIPETEGTVSVRPNEGWIRVRLIEPSDTPPADPPPGDAPPAEPPPADPPPGDAAPDDAPAPDAPPAEGSPADAPPADAPPDDAPPVDADPGRSSAVTVANVTFGSILFQQGSRTVGYQGGGVFRSSGSDSTLVSRPEFHYRDGTLTIPIIKTDGKVSSAGVVQATHNGSMRKFPDPERGMTNKLNDTTVTVTVRSRYYQAWAEFFREQTTGDVRVVDDDSQTVTVAFDQGSEGRVEFLHVTVHRMTVTGG